MFAVSTQEAIAPTAQDAQIARESSAALGSLLNSAGTNSSHLILRTEDNHESDIALPSSVLPLLCGALREMAKGNVVTLLPVHAELTTQQAAEMLRVSRPSLIKMLDCGKLPYRKIGAHRRVLYSDVLDYRTNEHARRVKVMEELVAETERLDLY